MFVSPVRGNPESRTILVLIVPGTKRCLGVRRGGRPCPRRRHRQSCDPMPFGILGASIQANYLGADAGGTLQGPAIGPAIAGGKRTMNRNELARIAQAMVAKGKGILAADESSGTIRKRFDAIRLESTEEHRRSYREMLFTAPGAAEAISGVILYDETIRQKTRDGVPFPQYLTQQGMIPGIKVDLGAKPLAGFPGETITEGLDGLRQRFVEYRSLGARFAKWRAVIDI